MLRVEVPRLAGIGLEVVELSRCLRVGVGQRVLRELRPSAVAIPAGALVVEVLPLAAADRERERDRLLEQELANGLVTLFTEQDGQQVEAVFGSRVGQLRADDRRAGGHHVGEADQLIGHRSRLDAAGPARDERDAVAALPLIALHPAPRPRAVVLVIGAHVDRRGGLGPVVAGEDHQRVVRHAESLESAHQLADDPVELEDEVTVRPGVRLPLERVGGEGRQVHRLCRVVEEERSVGCRLHVLLEEGHALLQEEQVHLLQVEVGRDQPGAVVLRVGVLRQRPTVEDSGRRDGNPIAVDEGVQPVGGRAAHRAEEVIEAAVDRRVGARARVVDSLHRFQPVLVDRHSIPVEEPHPDVPLAEARGRIPGLAQHPRESEPPFLDQARAADTGEDAPHPGAEGHAAGEQAVARRRADGGRAVRVGEEHPLRGEAIEVRRRDLALGVVAADVAVAEVVGEDDDDVRVPRPLLRRGADDRGERDKKEQSDGGSHTPRIRSPAPSHTFWGSRCAAPASR